MKRTSKKNIKKNGQTGKKEITAAEKSFLKNNLKYIFLTTIFFYLISDILTKLNPENNLENIKSFLQIPAIILGFLSLYFEKNKLKNTVNKLFSASKEQKTKPFFSKSNIFTIISLSVILIISGFTLFHKLDNFDIFSDEVQVTRGAAGYYHTGEYRQWDFVKKELVGKPYNRAKPHQWFVAQSYKIFGINTRAARFPSALFSLIFILIFYFIAKYFIKDKYAALLTVFSFALYFEFLFLGRWARMYAMIFPIFITLFYLTFKLITEKNRLKALNLPNNSFFNKYLNFNYIYLPIILVLFYVGINTHTNITAVFLVFYVFFLFSVFLFPEEKKYLTAFLIATLILVLQILFPYKVNLSQFTFFEINNSEVYLKALFGYPFSVTLSVIIIFASVSIFIFSDNNEFKKKFLILYSTALTIFISFSYIINYPSSYRYVSFISPLTVLLIIGSFMLINKILYGKIIQTTLVLMLVFTIILNFKNHYESLYVTNTYSPAKPSVAYKKVVNNFHKGDVIFMHWGPKMYLKGIPSETKFISLGSYKGRNFQDILQDMRKYPHGWLIWHKYNELRLDPDFVSYCNLYFKKYAGYGIDNTGEEIYYYDKSMLQPAELFAYQKFMPVANLSTGNSYTFVFDTEINKNTEGDIFYLLKNTGRILKIYVKNQLLTAKLNDKDSIFLKIPENIRIKAFLLLSQEKISLTANNKKTEKNIKIKSNLVKFTVNPQFKGYVNNIRIYDFLLDNKQIQTIKSDKNASEELSADGKKFRTLFLWKKK